MIFNGVKKGLLLIVFEDSVLISEKNMSDNMERFCCGSHKKSLKYNMKESKVSDRSFDGKSHQNLMDSSLMVKVLDEEIQFNTVQIHKMENFLQTKYAQIGDLQNYLLSELQDIENCKSRNKRIENILISTIIPTIHQVRETLNSLKSLFDPFQMMAFNYVEAVSEKCKNLIKEKDFQIQQYEIEIKRLKAQTQELNKQKKNEITILRDTEPIFLEKKTENKPTKTQLTKTSPLEIVRQDKSCEVKGVLIPKSINTSNLNGNKSHEQKRYTSKMGEVDINDRSPNNFNKYEQCYKNIIENKKTNIHYRCEKSPTFSNLDRQRKSLSIIKHKEACPDVRDRKTEVKQKIEKIKWQRGEVFGRKIV